MEEKLNEEERKEEVKDFMDSSEFKVELKESYNIGGGGWYYFYEIKDKDLEYLLTNLIKRLTK